MAETMDEKVLSSDPKNDEKVAYSTVAHTGEPPSGLVMKDGIPVHPQPTSDPLDPLNWSKTRKHAVLGVVMLKYFLFTYITSTTVPSFLDLQTQFNASYQQINWTLALPALGLAVGPLVWSSPSDIFGRRLIFIIGTIMALASTIGAALAPNYGGYMAARFFQGLGVAPASTVGLAAINDMFFEHERGQKIGLWVLAIDMGLLVGPIFGGFLNIVSSAWIQWFTAILFGVLLMLELAFMPETLYPRNRMLKAAALSNSHEEKGVDFSDVKRRRSEAPVVEDLPRTRKLPFINYKPVPGIRHPKVWSTIFRFMFTFKYQVINIAVLGYSMLWYWWLLSVITLLPVAYIQYSPQIQGLLFIGLLLGTLVAEATLGGTLSDYLMLKLTKRNNNVRMPEMRLWLAYPAGLLSALGLVIWGISIDRGYHWIVGQIAFFMLSAGIQVGNTVICAYVVDSYPLQSMSVIVYYVFFLNLSAFIDPFFIAPWQAASGWTWCFAAQGIILFFGALPCIGALQYFGARIRAANGLPPWVNPEFDNS